MTAGSEESTEGPPTEEATHRLSALLETGRQILIVLHNLIVGWGEQQKSRLLIKSRMSHRVHSCRTL